MEYEVMTIEDIERDIKAIEEKISEPQEVKNCIDRVSKSISESAKSDKHIIIHSDYDADGITSAYIIEKTLKAVNPNADVTVLINDRRNGYGVSKDLSPYAETRYIILDMGSNEYDYISKNFGKDTIILDHHIIEDENIKHEFTKSELLLNPHAFSCEDGKSSEYCTAGLAYRVYQTIKEREGLTISEKTDNTISALACIGTVADVVDLFDIHSYNRHIVKSGIDVINNAEPENLDFTLGYMLTKSGKFGKQECTAHDIAFFSALFNSCGRMSETLNVNGSQLTYNVLSEEESVENCNRVDRLIEINDRRKSLVGSYQKSVDYNVFVTEELTKKFDSNVCVYLMPENTPTAFCGIIAGKLCSTLNKAAIVCTYNTQKDNWSGSARNVDGQTPIYKFMQEILEKPEAEGIEIKYGGHDNAFGISKLNDGFKLVALVEQYHELMKPAPPILTVFDMGYADLKNSNVPDRLKQLEPLGKGYQLPLVKIKGILEDCTAIQNRTDWKTMKIKTEDKTISLNDWEYKETKYPTMPVQDDNGEEQKEISFLAEVNVVCKLKKTNLEGTVVFNRAFLQDRVSEIEKHQTEQQIGKESV